ncbi:MAG TPA: hypothetical protein VMD99_14195 [Terriglobales bacterium]|nr:hypothetical protein [Terriglobales bacterium]
MTGTTARLVRFGTGLLGLAALGWFLTGHAAEPTPEGLPTDWTHQHVIFSQPGTAEQAQRVGGDLRYWQQWYRQKMSRALAEQAAHAATYPVSSRVGSQQQNADWSENLGSGASAGAGNFPAKYSYLTNSWNCGRNAKPDYVVFGTGLQGTSGQASIVAYDNLYSGCSGTVPQVYWAYNTGGQMLTSPVVSEDGKQVAFVQTDGGFGIVTLLKWASSATESVTSPSTLVPVGLSSYRACVAPCMTEVFIVDGQGTEINDTTSSVFVDYTHDTLWVGGALGWLHKITGVFRGTPAEVTTGGFPVQVYPADPTSLSSPVYDFASTDVFVGDYGGYFYRVNSSTGVATRSAQVDHETGLVAAPIVDSTAELIYVFSSNDASTSCSSGPCAAVYEFTPTFASGAKPTRQTVGVGSTLTTPNPLYEGALDGAYETSTNATGSLFVCGNTGGDPTLYQITITKGVFKLLATGPTLASSAAGCSPVSDVPNPNISSVTSEWIFASAKASGNGNSCASGGCIMNFANKAWTAATAYVVGQEIMDDHFQVQVARTPGTSGATAPAWAIAIGGGTSDGTTGLTWVNQGPQTAGHAPWAATKAYALHQEILDSNGNIEDVNTPGTSGSTPPTWSTTVGVATKDGSVSWLNVGTLATASLAAAGGTSGIIMDNTVPPAELAGASQIYYSTQTNQTCGTSGTGGCAVQASQSALQ